MRRSCSTRVWSPRGRGSCPRLASCSRRWCTGCRRIARPAMRLALPTSSWVIRNGHASTGARSSPNGRATLSRLWAYKAWPGSSHRPLPSIKRIPDPRPKPSRAPAPRHRQAPRFRQSRRLRLGHRLTSHHQLMQDHCWTPNRLRTSNRPLIPLIPRRWQMWSHWLRTLSHRWLPDHRLTLGRSQMSRHPQAPSQLVMSAHQLIPSHRLMLSHQLMSSARPTPNLRLMPSHQ